MRGTGYGQRTNPVTGQPEFHRGNDYSVPRKTPIYAPTDGTVVEGKDRRPDTVDGFGNWIWIDAQRTVGKDFIFGHLEHSDILVRRGDQVRAGDLIGYVGSAGQSTGPHLHFEVWGAPGRVGGDHIDPAAWLKRAGAVDPGAISSPDSVKTTTATVPSSTKGKTVATAADVKNQLTADGQETQPFWESVRLFENRKDASGNDTSYWTKSMRRALFAVAFEMTLHLRNRGLTALKASWGKTDTMLGHAVNAASWGRVNFELLKLIATKVGATEAEIDAAVAAFTVDPA
ncbi:hypothetical protein IM25_22655 [Rhodococcus sp. p52]|uniref:M23 family metallopeptidase n=1 Tax=Rhodococcus sp. p52 TaxID=935199 RepID=UPI0008260CEF|nr:M23 family metallopeptidase [Rhodococcus sp. p52]AOD24034.1 hypothetical protein IM25_22655 [Rhodococcus sp. p52]